MGSGRARAIEAQINNLDKLESKKGYEFNMLKNRIKNIGTSDYSMKRAITYRENYIREMEKYSHLDNYELLVEKFKSLSNPEEFYEFVSENELTQDLTYQSDMYFTQQAFNSYLEMLGIEIKIDSVS